MYCGRVYFCFVNKSVVLEQKCTSLNHLREEVILVKSKYIGRRPNTYAHLYIETNPTMTELR